MVEPPLGSSLYVTGRSRVPISWPVLSGHSGQVCSEWSHVTPRAIRRNSENGYYCILALPRWPGYQIMAAELSWPRINVMVYAGVIHILCSRIRGFIYGLPGTRFLSFGHRSWYLFNSSKRMFAYGPTNGSNIFQELNVVFCASRTENRLRFDGRGINDQWYMPGTSSHVNHVYLSSCLALK